MMNENQLKYMLDEMLPSDRYYPAPREDVLVRKIRFDYDEMKDSMSNAMYFVRDIVEDKVIAWLKEYTPEFLMVALEDPKVLAGSEEFNDALTALGYMKDWDQVDPETLDSDDDYSRWQDWSDAREGSERHPH